MKQLSIPATPNSNVSSVNQISLRSEASNLNAIDKISPNAYINNEEEDNNMDIDENQQELEIVQIEPVSDEVSSISPTPNRIPRSNRNSNSLASPQLYQLFD